MPTVLQKIFGNMYDDIRTIKSRYNIYGIDCDWESKEEELDELVDLLNNKYGESSITDIFKEDSIMIKFFEIRKDLNLKLTDLDKNIEERQKQKEEEEKYKALTEEEQRQHIKEIDDNNFDITSTYKKILEYEEVVARIRGLLNKKESMQIEDMRIDRIEEDMYEYIVRLRKSGARFEVFPNIDEKSKRNTMVARVEGINLEGIRITTYTPTNKNNVSTVKFGIPFIRFMQDRKLDEYTTFSEELQIIYPNQYIGSNGRNKKRTEIEETIELIKKEKSGIQVNEVKFYIEMSYLRPMIPILEKLKSEGIEYYIVPIDNETLKKEPTKKIYMNREDLQKYKEKVHTQISNGEKGIITIGAEDMDEAKLMIGDAEKFLDENEKEF